MTIEIKTPELKALIDERLKNGRFQDVDDLLTTALSKLPDDSRFERNSRREAVARMREFSRQTKLSLGKPVSRALLHEDHRF